jgi:hypothetical protein
VSMGSGFCPSRFTSLALIRGWGSWGFPAVPAYWIPLYTVPSFSLGLAVPAPCLWHHVSVYGLPHICVTSTPGHDVICRFSPSFLPDRAQDCALQASRMSAMPLLCAACLAVMTVVRDMLCVGRLNLAQMDKRYMSEDEVRNSGLDYILLGLRVLRVRFMTAHCLIISPPLDKSSISKPPLSKSVHSDRKASFRIPACFVCKKASRGTHRGTHGKQIFIFEVYEACRHLHHVA